MRQIQNIRSLTAIFWLGFFMAISFLETPLKFTISGLSLVQAVSIGRVVFGALNKCEWGLFLLLAATCLLHRPDSFVSILIVIAGFILLIQTFYLLPILEARAAG